MCQAMQRVSGDAACVRRCSVRQVMQRVSGGEAFVRWCSVRQVMKRVSGGAACVRWCSVRKVMKRVSGGAAFVRWCSVYLCQMVHANQVPVQLAAGGGEQGVQNRDVIVAAVNHQAEQAGARDMLG